MKRLFFIYNPYAGKSQIKSSLSDVVDIFVKAGYEVVIRPTQGPLDTLKQVEKLPDEYDLVVVSGGDGTLDLAVTGMMHREEERRIPIGYLPTGSTNDFGNSLGIPQDLLKAAAAAVSGEEFPCDMGSFNETSIFIYVAAFGLFTDVSYETPQEKKNILGHFAYLLEGTKRLAAIKDYHLRITCNGEEIEDDFIYGMVSNSRRVGGFSYMLNKQEVAFDDGYFEVTLVKKPENLVKFGETLNALLIADYSSDQMITFHTREILFECDEEIAWTMDGEDGGKHRKVRIADIPTPVTLMLPKDQIANVSCRCLSENEEKLLQNDISEEIQNIHDAVKEEMEIRES